MNKVGIAPLGVMCLALAACSPPVPDSRQGVGFGSYSDYLNDRQAREQALAGQRTTTLAPANRISPETRTTTSPPPGPAVPSSAPANTSLPAPDASAQTTASAPNAHTASAPPLQANPSNPAPRQIDNPGISDENDFRAVSSRQSIESDAARLRNNRAQYEVVTPEALPSRSGSATPNIVEYAISTQHAVGQQVYRRSRLTSQTRHQRACGQFTSSDKAQQAFLAAGGPKKDRMALDPDGDGFACSWNPTPFRRAVGG